MMVALDGVSHHYDDAVAVRDVSFGLESGEVVALLGPSGCGKTTLVQAIAGHVSPTAGRIRLRGRDVTPVPPESRGVGVVFQEPTVFPHMTVAENVAYGLVAGGVEPAERDETVSRYLDLVSLRSHREDYPSALSGGEKRRVELARALAPEPDLLVLDEPLSGLDRALREELREEIARIQRRVGVTTLYVTHDQEEAMALADRLVVMAEGRVAATGRPRELLESPPTPFVASFLGWTTELPVTVSRTDDPGIDRRAVAPDETVTGSENGPVRCSVRPGAITLGPPGDCQADVCLPGVVARVADRGKRYDVTVRLDCGEELTVEQSATPPGAGNRTVARFDSGDVMVYDGTG
jgi:ABC-type Fe3+/spermidine/putrescine transport system ATPase subunit